jgi:hypothetical protein
MPLCDDSSRANSLVLRAYLAHRPQLTTVVFPRSIQKVCTCSLVHDAASSADRALRGYSRLALCTCRQDSLHLPASPSSPSHAPPNTLSDGPSASRFL